MGEVAITLQNDLWRKKIVLLFIFVEVCGKQCPEENE